MTLNWTPDPDDFEVFDLRETVTFYSVSADGTPTEYTGVMALGQDGITEQVQDLGGVQSTPKTTTWHLRADTIGDGTIVPARGDRIVSTNGANTGTWVVLQADIWTNGTRWVCQTQRTES